MKLYEKNLVDFTEVDESVIRDGLQNGTIVMQERIKEHHIVPEDEKRPAKSAEEIYNEMKANGESVEIHNGVYCKFIYNTYEAINPITAIDDWDEYEEIYVKGE